MVVGGGRALGPFVGADLLPLDAARIGVVGDRAQVGIDHLGLAAQVVVAFVRSGRLLQLTNNNFFQMQEL